MNDNVAIGDFLNLMRTQAEWRKLTLEQLKKDFALAGFNLDLGSDGLGYDELKLQIIAAIEVLRENPANWQNLNYRIDLPENLHIDSLSDESVAELWLFRSFQKVWLRQFFSTSDANHSKESNQKDLKH